VRPNGVSRWWHPAAPGNGKSLPLLPDAAVIAGHQRRYSPQMTRNHKNNRK
jgi:hypothetical protein